MLQWFWLSCSIRAFLGYKSWRRQQGLACEQNLIMMVPLETTLDIIIVKLAHLFGASKAHNSQFTIAEIGNSHFGAADVVPVERDSLNNIITWWNPNSTLPIRAYELLNLTAHPSSPEVLSGHPLGTATYADPTMACAYNPDCYLAISFDLMQKHLFTYSYFGFWLANEVITTIT